MRILVAERISDKGIEYLKKNVDVDVKLGLSMDELCKLMPNYDGLIVRSTVKVNAELLDNSPNLKIIGRAGNGVDNIDIEEATKRGIIVVNTPDANSVSAAEHTIGLMLSCARNIPEAYCRIKRGDWRRNSLKGVELYKKTVGIIGLGRIGSIVASRLKSFQMKVIAYDPYVTDERFTKLGVERVNSLDEFLPRCDFITIHTPKTSETLGMIGYDELKKMKKTARIINCARGGIIDEKALKKALDEKLIGGAAIDVLEVEPLYDLKDGETQKYNNALLDSDNLIITPHLGASTYEAQDNVGISVAKEVMEALHGMIVENAVNLPTVEKGELNILKPYMELSEKMGKLYYQINKTSVNKIEIIYSGEVAKYNVRILTHSYLRGLLSSVSDRNINNVNSYYVAHDFGIDVVEATSNECGNYTSLIRVKVYSGNQVRTFAGTVFGINDIRITEISGYMIDVVPEKYLLLLNNKDKPGYVGRIGTMLGNADINIATMRVSRNRKGEAALMAITVDDLVPEDVLNGINNMDGIENTKFIMF